MRVWVEEVVEDGVVGVVELVGAIFWDVSKTCCDRGIAC